MLPEVEKRATGIVAAISTPSRLRPLPPVPPIKLKILIKFVFTIELKRSVISTKGDDTRRINRNFPD